MRTMKTTRLAKQSPNYFSTLFDFSLHLSFVYNPVSLLLLPLPMPRLFDEIARNSSSYDENDSGSGISVNSRKNED